MGWGLIGTGGYARRACAPAFTQVEGADLVAVASSDIDRARSFAAEVGAPLATDDFSTLLAAEDVQAVWVASPSYKHYEQGQAALNAGKHVLMEKPLALTPAEAWQLVALAEVKGVVLATGYQARYVPAHLRMKELLDEGAIGTAVMARSYYGLHRTSPPHGWRLNREQARWGALADIGTHHLDLLRMFMGEVESVYGFAARRTALATDDAATAVLSFADGALGVLAASTVVGRPATMVELLGTAGALVAEGTSPDGQGSATLIRPGREPEDITGERPLSSVAQLDTVTKVMSGEKLDYASGADGARNVELMERISP
jgi:1,5-anhydro-D-fructose reductase (1,5-anhydro-D-mannitol-forming)